MFLEAVSVFADDQQTDEARLVAFENLEMMLENIDNAVNVGRMKQWDILLPLIKSDNNVIRRQTLHLVAICAQNNPEVQGLLATMGVIDQAHRLVLDQDQPIEVRRKAMLVISSLVQHNHANYQYFTQTLDGFKSLDTILADTTGCDSNLAERIMFFVRSIMPGAKDSSIDDDDDASNDLDFDPEPYPEIMKRLSSSDHQ